MADPFAILQGSQVSVPNMLSVYQGAQDQRIKQILAQKQLDEIERHAKIAQVFASIKNPNAKGGDPASGVGAAYAPPAAAPTSLTPAAPATVAATPQPTTHPNVLDGHPEYTAHPSAPQTWLEANQGLVDQAMGIDPAQAFSLQEHFQKLDDNQKKQVTERTGLIGELARYADTPQKWDEAIDWAAANGHPDLAQYKGHFSPSARMSAIATAGLIDKFNKDNADRYMAYPGQGGGIVRLPAPGVGGAPEPVAGAPIPSAPPQAAPGNPVADAKSIVSSLYPQARVTDWQRDPKSPLGRANPGSYHNSTKAAVDVAPIPGMTFDQYIQGIRDAGHTVIEAFDEQKHPMAHTTGPNWHVVIGTGDPHADMRAAADAAIAKGADPEAVRARLRQMGGG